MPETSGRPRTSKRRFRSATLDSVALAPGGQTILGLDRSASLIELLPLDQDPGPPEDASTSIVIGGPGTSIGQLDGPQAVAAMPDGAAFVVLERSRLQAFTLSGDPAEIFAGSGDQLVSTTPLFDNGVAATYTDPKIDLLGGYIFVTSYEGNAPTPADFRLDIYRRNGTFVKRTRGLVAARFALSKWRDIYTLNFTPSTNPLPEPTISEWLTYPLEGATDD